MSNNDKVFEQENVNGVALYLKIDNRKGSPRSMNFTVSYKNKKKKSTWPLVSLFLSILFNIVALIYVRISVTSILVILIVLSVLLLFWVTHSVQTESMLVIPTVGIQSSVKYVLGREDNFVPWSSIDDIIINEAIKLNRVLYFLTVLVKNSCDTAVPVKLMPLFKYTKPRLAMIQLMYSKLQTLLVDSQKESTAMGSGDVG